MKKIALVLALVLSMSVFAACGNEPAETTAPETTLPETVLPTDTTPLETEAVDPEFNMTETEPEFTLSATEELIYAIYEQKPVELMLMTMPLDLTDEYSLSHHAGLATAEGIVEAAISEPMIGSQAYSMVVVKCESTEKAAEVAQTMFDNIDTAKWICVQADTKQAAVSGDTVMFCMIYSELGTELGVTVEDLVAAFESVMGSVDAVIK